MGNIKEKIHRLLIYSERFTGTDMVYLSRGGFWLGVPQFFSVLSGFILAIVFANLLSKETYGAYRYIISLAGIFSITSLSGLDTAIMRAVSRQSEGSFIPALKTKIKWGFLGSAAAVCSALYYYYFKNDPTIATALFIIAPFLPFVYSLSLYSALLNGKKDFKTQGTYNFITQLVLTASLIASVFLSKNLFLLIFVLFAVQTGINLLFHFRTLKRNPPNDKENSEAITFGKHLSFIGVLDIIAINIDEVLIYNFLGTVSVAIFSFALLIPKQIDSFLVRILNPLSIPKFAQKNQEELKATLLKKIVKFSLFMALAVVCYMAIAPIFFKIFFPQYMSSVRYSQIASLILLFSPFMFINFYFKAHLKTKNLYLTGIADRILRIIFLAALLPLYGIWGAIVAPLAASAISVPYSIYLFKKS